MASFDMKPIKWAREIPTISAIQDESTKRMEAAAAKNWKTEKIFEMGQKWHINGKSLNDARSSVKFDGRDLTEEEFNIFKKGFMYIPRSYAFSYGKRGKKIEDFPEEYTADKDFMDSYNEGCGFKYGYDGVSVGELPVEFVQNKKFLAGYKNGIEAKAKENNKESKKRR